MPVSHRLQLIPLRVNLARMPPPDSAHVENAQRDNLQEDDRRDEESQRGHLQAQQKDLPGDDTYGAHIQQGYPPEQETQRADLQLQQITTLEEKTRRP